MYQKLTDREIDFMICHYDPVASIECIFPENIKAPHSWSSEDCKMIKVRNYQFGMVNYSFMYADDPKLSDQQNFSSKINAGRIINIAARNIGKSYLLICDALLNIKHGMGDEGCLASFDFKHLKKICTPVANFVNFHPLFQIFKRKGKSNVRFTGGGMEIDTLRGYIMYGKNENVDAGEDAGVAFHGLHTKWLGYEEASYMSDKGTEKRIDSVHSHGCIERLSGIPDLRIGSPLGKILVDPKNKKFICRLPQCVRPDWTPAEKIRLAEQYNGVESIAYKVNVDAELLEAISGKFDMKRIREKCLLTDKKIKFFEIGKENFRDYKTILGPVERIPCQQIIIASDIGTRASPSEVCIFFRGHDKWQYAYQISLFEMTFDEQATIFKYLYEKLGTAFISLDRTNADGDSIAVELARLGIPKVHLTEYRMGQNIEVDFEKDEQGNPVIDNSGKPVMRKVNTKEFGVQCLENILYKGELEVPYQEKFLKQFGGFLEMKTTSGRMKYDSVTDDHLVDSFIVFALAAWELESKENRNIRTKRRTLGIIG